MTRWRFKLLLLVLIGIVITVFFIDPSHGARNHSPQSHINYKKTVLTVGYLTAIKGELKDKQGLAISGALKMALDEVCHHSVFFPSLTLFRCIFNHFRSNLVFKQIYHLPKLIVVSSISLF